MVSFLTPEQVARAREAAVAAGQGEIIAVIDEVCDVMGVRPEVVRSPKRSRLLDAVRGQIYRVCLERRYSQSAVARAMNRDHSTICEAYSIIAGESE